MNTLNIERQTALVNTLITRNTNCLKEGTAARSVPRVQTKKQGFKGIIWLPASLKPSLVFHRKTSYPVANVGPLYAS